MTSLGTLAHGFMVFPTISVLKSKHSRIHKVVFWKSSFSSCCLKTDSIYIWVLGIIFVSLYVLSQIFYFFMNMEKQVSDALLGKTKVQQGLTVQQQLFAVTEDHGAVCLYNSWWELYGGIKACGCGWMNMLNSLF